MDLTSAKIPLKDIKVSKRVRETTREISELASSIEESGLLQPIVLQPVGDTYELVAGQRRFEAFKILNQLGEGFDAIPSVFYKGKDKLGIELIENISRRDFNWRDKANGMLTWHKEQMLLKPDATQGELAAKLGISKSNYNRDIKVAHAIGLGMLSDSELKECSSVQQAQGKIERKEQRKLQVTKNETALDDALELTASMGLDTTKLEQRKKIITEDTKTHKLICADFNLWAKDYEGKFFDFIHVDFPYGVLGNMQVSDYTDSKDIYFQLLQSFIKYQNNFMAENTNIMFWFSMKYYAETVAMFRAGGFDVFAHPFVWVKTDSKGHAIDSKRYPRQNVETALHVRRGDPLIRRVINQGIACPRGDNTHHISTKPLKVLEAFFEMYVDGDTNIFDPTAGSGCIYMPALHAKSITMLELSMEHCTHIKSFSHLAIEDLRTPEERKSQEKERSDLPVKTDLPFVPGPNTYTDEENRDD